MIRRLVVTTAAAFVVTGCATRGSVRELQLDLARMSSDVAELQRSHEASIAEVARVQAEVRTIQTRNAELEAMVRDQLIDVTRMRARLDAAEYELRESRSRPPAPLVAAPAVASVGPTPVAAGSAPPRARTLAADDAERAYAAALANFRAREHGQAVLDFLDFLVKYPDHPQAASAQYWIGEAYYVQRDYRQAIVEFQRVLTMAPTSSRAGDALLKIGLAHTNLRENSPAQQAWRRLVADYPGSDSAGRARALLREHAARRQ
jgi:tol-pal system protein YbgF